MFYIAYKRYLWIIKTLFLCFLGMIVAIIVALYSLDLATVKNNIINGLRENTNLPINIDGDIKWKISLKPSIEMTNVSIPNATWAKNNKLFIADKIDVRLDLISLFNGNKPTIQRLKLHNAKFFLERNKDGKDSIIYVKENEEQKENTHNPDVQTKYLFNDIGIGIIEIENLITEIYGKKYSLKEFHIRHINMKHQSEYTGWVKTVVDKNLPFIISLSEFDEKDSVYPARVALATGGKALITEFKLNGKTSKIVSFSIQGDVPDINSYANLLNIDLIDIPFIQLDISGNVFEKAIVLNRSIIKIANNDLTFEGKYNWANDIPILDLNLSSNNINLYKSFPEWFGVGKEWIHPDRELNAFLDMPMFGNVLRDFTANIKIKMKHLIVYHNLDVSNINLNASLKNNNLKIYATTDIAKGHVKIAIDSDINEKGEYILQTAAQGEGVQLGKIMEEIEVADTISGVPLNLEFYLRSHGSNLSEIMQSLTGPLQVYSTDVGYMHSALVEYMYGADFLTTLRHNVEDLFSSDKKHGSIKIYGVAINLKFRDGLINTRKGVAIETNTINLLLSGDLDLGRETINLALTTAPVRGLKISLTSSLVNSIEITGNLSEPDININGTNIVGKVASATGLGLLLTPLTGGLSLVAGAGVGLLAGDFIENWLSDDHPCKTAMAEGAPIKHGDPDWFSSPLSELSKNLLLEIKD